MQSPAGTEAVSHGYSSPAGCLAHYRGNRACYLQLSKCSSANCPLPSLCPPCAQYPEALGFVKAAIQLAPANARYRRSLGVVHESAQQWLAAADAFERAIEKQPTDVQVGEGATLTTVT